jgi:ElaB/YqjD/DUF883 family membrane-anchored ribosome-binding protein
MNINEGAATNGEGQHGTLAHGVDRARAGAHHGIDAATDAAGPAVERMVAGAHATVDALGGIATHAAQTLDIKGHQLGKTRDRLMKGAGGYVQAHPLASLGMAVAAGYVLSRLLSAR